jgi:SAM-dependent methyltransferase
MSVRTKANILYRWAAELPATSLSKESKYGIRPGYFHRNKVSYFDDTDLTDEWQREVYLTAADLMKKEECRTVYDVGCGSGYKLVKYFSEYETTGFDVEPTVSFLKQKYPDRQWRVVPFDDRTLESAELVVCSDVIEHVPDPDALLNFLRHVTGRYLVLSTPDRNLIYGKRSPRRYGPPSNPTHIREWSFQELHDYVAAQFDILEHRVTNPDQFTQMIVCRPKAQT